jgi:phosphopantetheinyl transferase
VTGAVTLAWAATEAVLDQAGWCEGEALPTWLSGSERQRAGTLAAAARLQAFIAGRWLLRQVAACHAATAPGAWEGTAAEAEPPRLLRTDGRAADALHASLSHSGRWVAAAVADGPVGVDVEDRALVRPVARLAGRVLHPREQAWLAAQRDPAAAFLWLWTLKEAAIKGQGSRLGLHRLPRILCRPLDGPAGLAASHPAEDWSAQLWPGDELVLSLATPAVGEPGSAPAWLGTAPADTAQPWIVHLDRQPPA